jgi:hypothetical protein
MVFRIALIAAAVMLIDPGSMSDIIGVAVGGGIIGYDYLLSKKAGGKTEGGVHA